MNKFSQRYRLIITAAILRVVCISVFLVGTSVTLCHLAASRFDLYLRFFLLPSFACYLNSPSLFHAMKVVVEHIQTILVGFMPSLNALP
jgi:hypothetical protein